MDWKFMHLTGWGQFMLESKLLFYVFLGKTVEVDIS